MRSWIYAEGKKDGEQLGEQRGEQRAEQRSIVHLFEKRLGSPLTDAQRATLLRRLGALGYERVFDIGYDLAPDALAAWLEQADAA